MSATTTTMTEAKDPDTIVEEAHKKALNLTSNAKERDDDKTPTNATTERKETPNQATIAKTGSEGERNNSCDPINV